MRSSRKPRMQSYGIFRWYWRRLRRTTEKYFFHGSFGPVFSLLIACFLVTIYLLVDLSPQWTEADYPELRYPASGIRLLHIQPGYPRGALLYGELKSYSMAQRPDFEALTYTWGDMKHLKTININGKRMKISRNLHEALVSMRYATESRSLWVDQICINQADLEEKNSLIPLMIFIYTRARTTLMWLGRNKGPRWVENKNELDWSGEWVVRHAGQYPLAASYWLYLLAEEEYWKRT